ncbi:hypothetical protein ACIRPS_26250 [Streptomyces griseoviridis]
MKRCSSVFGVLLALLVAGLVVAPPAGATPQGCGDLSNGQLCITGPVPTPGTYTVSYWRHISAEITVRLGHQIKIERTGRIAQTTWLGKKKTQNGSAKLSRFVDLDGEGCIRGIMSHGGETFVSKWRC